MKISRNMNLSQLAEHMGNVATENDARRMRDLLVASGHESLDDVSDDVWMQMLNEAAAPTTAQQVQSGCATAADAMERADVDATVRAAIANSVRTTLIVLLRDAPGLRDTLSAHCDDNAESDGVAEYWGTDDDGDEWRIHVRLA